MLKTKQKIVLARAVQSIVMSTRKLAGATAQTQVKRNSILWNLDLREGIDFSIWLLGSFEPETVRCYQRIVKPGDVVLDIGANIGAHTLLLGKAVGNKGKVIAFEPTDYAFAKLSRNRALNPDIAPRIECLQYMLVDTESADALPGGIYSSWPLQEQADLHALHQGRLMSTSGAQARTLDSAVGSLGLKRVDCVKLDIDGFECGMLRGARETLARWQPPIIMEVAPYALEEQGTSVAELMQLLKGHGYALHHLSSNAALSMDADALMAMIPSGSSINVIARARC